MTSLDARFLAVNLWLVASVLVQYYEGRVVSYVMVGIHIGLYLMAQSKQTKFIREVLKRDNSN